MFNSSEKNLPPRRIRCVDQGLQRLVDRLSNTLERDELVQQTTDELRDFLQVDRVMLYYFYCHWEGQVTFESLSHKQFSIFGSTGPDECFNGEYAALYEAGRVRAIEDIETETLTPCHREFLRGLQVRANLVVPILVASGLWGLLIAHHCQAAHAWSSLDVEAMERAAQKLAQSPSIADSTP